MTTVEINKAFLLHCQNCEECGAHGLGLCYAGKELLKLFHSVIVEEVLRELPQRVNT